MALNKAKALKQADKFIAKQNYNKALNELLKVVKETPDDINLLNKVGDLFSKVGNQQNAISYFIKVAESHQKRGFNLKAIALYKKIIRIDDDYMDARHKLVDLYVQQGHHSEAKGELRRMAEHYYNENLFPRALTCYEKMVELEPNNLDARIRITEILVREGRRDEASDHFIAMGRELLDKTMVNEAKKMIGQGLKIAPKNTGLLKLLACTFIAEGKTDDALHHLTDICRREEDDLEALSLLGKTYLDLGRLHDAKTCFLRAIHISPEEAGHLEEVANRFVEAGELDQAYEALLPVSDIYLERKEWDDSIRLFRGVLYADENHLPSLEMLVKIYTQSQQPANAILSLEKIINYQLAHEQQREACDRIRQLLELDPNDQDWRAKLTALTGHSLESQPDLEGAEIHVFDDQEDKSQEGLQQEDGGGIEFKQELVPDEDFASQSGLSATAAEQMPQEDKATHIANHLTEASVYIKYGILDQALTHLLEVKKLDHLNVAANTKLKQLYLDKQEIDEAIMCLACLINAAIERGVPAEAEPFIAEIERYRPEVAAQHKARLESMGVASEPSGNSGFDLDFGSATPEVEPADGLLFNGQSNQEVVDFRDMVNKADSRVEAEAPAGEGTDMGWSLDMPAESVQSGVIEDFHNLYNQTLSEGADELPDMEAIKESGFLEADEPKVDPAAGLIDFEQGQPAQAEPVAAEPQQAAPPPATPQPATPQPAAPQPAAPQPATPQPAAPQPATPPPATPPPAEADANQPPPAAEEPVQHAALDSNAGSLGSELEEIDFFISVEAFEDATNLVNEAQKRFGEHPLLMERKHEIASRTQEAERRQVAFESRSSHADIKPKDPISEELGSVSSGFFDLAAELNEEFFEEDAIINDATSQEEIQSVEELFQEFKKGVEEQIEEGDHETHYDLGIAYKEMGLLEEAILEFDKASTDTGRFLECATMKGNCLIELGRAEDTIAHYESCLEKARTEEDKVTLRYELALAFQGFGELEKALELLRGIQETSPNYRNLDELIQALV